MQSPDIENLPPETTIGGFRIDHKIGEGAMAVVYKAVQVSLERPVALKILLPAFTEDQDYINRFFNEARSAAVFSHPNIVQAFDAGVTENNIYYFAMEYVHGKTLADLIEQQGTIPLLNALKIARILARALDYGWQKQQLSHGDIKPANILITEYNEIKLADFGLAKVRSSDFEGDGVMLTPLYAAPEVIQGDILPDTCTADIYSFGATLYHMLTGQPPFSGDSQQEIIQHQLHSPAPAALDVNPRVPQEISSYLTKLLSKQPSERPQSWKTVVKKLETFIRNIRKNKGTSQENQKENKPLKINYREKANIRGALERQRKKQKLRRQFLLFLMLLAALSCSLYWLYKISPPTQQSEDKKNEEEKTSSKDQAETGQQEERQTSDSSKTSEDEKDSDNRTGWTSWGDEDDKDSSKETSPFTDSDDPQNKTSDKEDGDNSTGWTSWEDEDEKDSSKETTQPADSDEESQNNTSDKKQTSSQEQSSKEVDYSTLINALKETPPTLSEPPDKLLDQTLELRSDLEDGSDKHSIVEFLNSKVLPSLKNTKEAFIKNQELLKGTRMPGIENKTIHKITKKGLMLEEKVPTGSGEFGSVSNLFSWQKLDSAENICPLAASLLTQNTQEGLIKVRPLLSYLSFNINSDNEEVRRVSREALSSYLKKSNPGIPSQELKLWKKLLKEMTGDT